MTEAKRYSYVIEARILVVVDVEAGNDRDADILARDRLRRLDERWALEGEPVIIHKQEVSHER